MESMERKDAPEMLEEPIKTENIIPNACSGDKRKGAVSPPPHCSICLGQLVNPSFTDSCLHQFCFTCLVEWSKIKTECPLCKQIFKSIIHNVRSERDYDLHHVPAQVTATLDVTADIHISGISGPWDITGQPFMYRTTMGHHRRSFGMIVNASAVARREQIPSIAHQIPSDERRRRVTDPIDYRRTVYRHGVWAIALPDAFGRYRQSSAEYYRNTPTEVNRLIPWLNRELQVLLNNNRAHIAYVLTVITETLTAYDIRSPEFKNIVRPYFGIHTDHFVHEFSTFARSNFDLHGYDQAVSYIPNRGLSNDYVPRAISPALSSSSSSSSDSDVRVLADGLDLTRLLHPMPTSSAVHFRPIDMPGPSTVSQMLRVSLPYTAPDVLTISSTSSSSENECEVVGYVKPRHERTPEIIMLSSSETEEANAAVQPVPVDDVQPEIIEANSESMPSTSSSCGNASNARQTRLRVKVRYGYMNSSSDSDSEANDSDYNPSGHKSRRHKTSRRKASKTTSSRKLHKRKKSTGTTRSRTKAARDRSQSSYCGSEEESLDRLEPSNHPRGRKRYMSRSSETSDVNAKPTKKKKRSKKSSRSKSKKSKKSRYEYSTTCSDRSSSESGSEIDENSKKRSRRRSRETKSTKSSHSVDSDGSECRSSRNSSLASYRSRKNATDDNRSSRRSSIASADGRKNVADEDRQCSSENESAGSRSSFSGDDYEKSKSDKSSASSSKSDASNKSIEHSVGSTGGSKERHRSRSKRKESKKRRRSHS
ncbi:hypothetical protein QAD02_024279 [Eretmocerus hayati]|uniref:Uncharacterized protein n=1 Tax=Eretmocerus hayati TaxID=131215 RepID=A0ACC2PYX5_9HYME|nr:hypothetical protein QAD02_024279 [Eretmocerus hayati]